MTANHLSAEKSPYLLQHAQNPVDWYPWGEDAFAKARAENKPIFLSIGYSTCHWCHVMEHESFENKAVAKVLNDHFVSIKVDREERPDIDGIYMNYVVATTGRGGWPMSVFLTPELKPFFGGTYFPPEDRYGMSGFKSLLASIIEAWRQRRDEILTAAESARAHLAEHVSLAKAVPASTDVLDLAYAQLKDTFDSDRGGFGAAPKFPMGHAISFLLRYSKRKSESTALQMAEATLTAMGRGGIFDQLGGGFHRYSTDAFWKLPHFEKMLYDQALLVRAYVEAYQATRNPFYERVARRTLDYVLREMTSEEGGFFSAQDADSADPESPGIKKEGAYFVWTRTQIREILPAADEEIFSYYYGINDGGNVEVDPHGEFGGKNVLHTSATLQEAAARFKLTVKQVGDSLLRSCDALLKKRQNRPRPHLDDKILTDWNGLMIGAFAAAACVFNEPRYSEAASRAAEFIHKRMRRDSGELYHRYREGDAAIRGFLADYAFLAEGLVALHEATGKPQWLLWALELGRKLIEQFWDEAQGVFYMSALTGESLLSRHREDHDGAVPSGASAAARVLLMLHHLTGDDRYEAIARRAFDGYGMLLESRPSGMCYLLGALDMALGPVAQIVIVDGQNEAELGKMKTALYESLLPNKVVLLKQGGAPDQRFEQSFELSQNRPAPQGRTAAYVCRDRVCDLPQTDAAEFKKRLTEFK